MIVKNGKEHRNKWKLARVTKNSSDKNGLIRTATVAFGDQSLTNTGERSYTLTLADGQTYRQTSAEADSLDASTKSRCCET